MHEADERSAEAFKYWILNFEERVARIVYQDGRTVVLPLDMESEPELASSAFDWENWWIYSFTKRGHPIITMGFNPNSPPSRHGMPAVYLDQNHWRTLSDVMREPSLVSDAAQRDAAKELIHLALDGGVILPLSSGHMAEATGLDGDLRYHVGVAMASLSGGWQLRHPIDIWKREAERSMRSCIGLEDSSAFHTILTDPGALFSEDTGLGVAENASDCEKFQAMLTMPNVILSMLINPEQLPKESLTNWIDHHTRITSQILSSGGTKEHRRRLALRRYWNENISYYTVPYRRLTRSQDFPTFSDRDLRDLLSGSPMAGLLAELFVLRFTDRNRKWQRNDLTDIFYLTSAAAYADYVCAEKHTGVQLRQAQRSLGRKETVFTSLSPLVEALRKDGVKTESERQISRTGES
ncbi:hypothetical protein [Brevibacterium zhoupengii]|uniref:hypothetical protein n=1 Tax=Brevibacterium zhoupengii TaxID=2898795 RepID=UPI001F09B571|nr:hypothetical protein [Brevibacterium zhoupengii]